MTSNSDKIEFIGTVVGNPTYDHTIVGEGFYNILVASHRTSGTEDTIVIKISERLIDVSAEWIGVRVKVLGEIQSFNRKPEDVKEGENKLALYIFAKEIELAAEDEDDLNEGELVGVICNEPNYRKTPLGREITDFCFAVNRNYGKSSYIPCLVWGRNAKYVAGLPVGTKMRLTGRFQSREHNKTLEDGTVIKKTVYEFSVSNPTVETD